MTPTDNQSPKQRVVRASEFSALEHTTLVADTSSLIRAMIIEGRLSPGDRLPSERELSEALNVSRATLREAIQSLVAIRVLVTTRGSGTFVGSLDLEDLLEPAQFALSLAGGNLGELFELRLMVEPEIAALAAERATDEERTELLRIAELTAERAGDPVQLLELDEALHMRLAEYARNGIVLTVHRLTAALAHSSRSVTARLPAVAVPTAEHHLEIARAVIAGDADKARATMREHLQTIRDLNITNTSKPLRPSPWPSP
ncbi:FadR/GntR family transcriptional regulator [Agromyces bauzanensis]